MAGHRTKSPKKHVQSVKKECLQEAKKAPPSFLKVIKVIGYLRMRLASFVDFEDELKKNVLDEYKKFRKICKEIGDKLLEDDPSKAIFQSGKQIDLQKNQVQKLEKELKELEKEKSKLDRDFIELGKSKDKKLDSKVKEKALQRMKQLGRTPSKGESDEDLMKNLKKLFEEEIKKLNSDLEKAKEGTDVGDSKKAIDEYFKAVSDLNRIQNKITMCKNTVVAHKKMLNQKEKEVRGIKKEEDADKYLKKLQMQSKNFYKTKRQFYYDYEHLSQGVFSAIIELKKLLNDSYKKMMSSKDYKALAKLQKMLRIKKKQLLKEEKIANAQSNKIVSDISKQSA